MWRKAWFGEIGRGIDEIDPAENPVGIFITTTGGCGDLYALQSTEGLDLPFYQLGKVLSGGALMSAAEFYQCSVPATCTEVFVAGLMAFYRESTNRSKGTDIVFL